MNASNDYARDGSRGVAGFTRGVGDIWRGLFFLVARPSLWFWAIIPFILNVALLALTIALGWHYFQPWVATHVLHAHAWLEAHAWLRVLVGWLLGAVFWILAAVGVFFGFLPLATLVASPFNDILSEKTEMIYARAPKTRLGFAGMARSIRVSIVNSVWLTLLTLGLLALTLPLHLIPGFGSLAASVLAAVITIWFLSLQFTAYSMDRRFYSIGRRADFQRRYRARALGLGTMAFGVMLVPVVNLMFIPVSAVAGTMLFCDAELGGRSH